MRRYRGLMFASAALAALVGLALLSARQSLLTTSSGVAPASTADRAIADSGTWAAPVRAEPDRSPHEFVSAASIADPDEALLARWHSSSQRGTEVDGGITLSASGELLLNLGLRRLIEHFLSLTGEFSESDIRHLLALHAQAQHGDAVMQQVLDAFDRYLGMRSALSQMPETENLATRFAAIRAIRQQWFGEASDAMFGDEHAQVSQTLERRAIASDPDLTTSEREQLLADFDATRPAENVAAERIALGAQLAEEQTQQLDAINASADARFTERSALWGDEAAQRLAALDQSRLQWDQRLSDYASQRDRIRADPRLNAAAREAALDALLTSRFSGNERVRIESLEAIGALPSG